MSPSIRGLTLGRFPQTPWLPRLWGPDAPRRSVSRIRWGGARQPRPGRSGRQIGPTENFASDRRRKVSRGEQQLFSGGACHCNPQLGLPDGHGSQGAGSSAGGSREVFGPADVGGPHGVLRDTPTAPVRGEPARSSGRARRAPAGHGAGREAPRVPATGLSAARAPVCVPITPSTPVAERFRRAGGLPVRRAAPPRPGTRGVRP